MHIKEAHPGLNDGDIDRLQELTARRQSIAAERDAQTRLNLDHQIEGTVTREAASVRQSLPGVSSCHAARRECRADVIKGQSRSQIQARAILTRCAGTMCKADGGVD